MFGGVDKKVVAGALLWLCPGARAVNVMCSTSPTSVTTTALGMGAAMRLTSPDFKACTGPTAGTNFLLAAWTCRPLPLPLRRAMRGYVRLLRCQGRWTRLAWPRQPQPCRLRLSVWIDFTPSDSTTCWIGDATHSDYQAVDAFPLTSQTSKSRAIWPEINYSFRV